MADTAESPTTEVGTNEQTISFKEYQNLQKKLSSAQTRVKQLASENARLSADNTPERVETLVTGFLDTLGAELTGPAQERVKALQEQASSSKVNNIARVKARSELAQLTEGMEDTADIDVLVNDGKLDEAVVLARSKSVSGTTMDIEAIVATKVAEQLRVLGKVDIGTTTVTGPTLDMTALSRVDTRRMSQAQLKEHETKLDAAYFKATGVHLS